MTMNTAETIEATEDYSTLPVNLASANLLGIKIANACNGAMDKATKAPYRDFARILIELDPADRNSALYTAILTCGNSGAWNLAKTAIRQELTKQGYAFLSSGPHYTKKDERKVPFKIGTKAEKDAETAKKAAADEADSAEFKRIELERAAAIQLERDRETTAETLAASTLVECQRLGIDPRDVAHHLVSPAFVLINADEYASIMAENERMRADLSTMLAIETAPAPKRGTEKTTAPKRGTEKTTA